MIVRVLISASSPTVCKDKGFRKKEKEAPGLSTRTAPWRAREGHRDKGRHGHPTDMGSGKCELDNNIDLASSILCGE